MVQCQYGTGRKPFHTAGRGRTGKGMVLWQEEKTAEEGICVQVKARGKTEAICTVIRTDGAGNARSEERRVGKECG